MFVVFKLNFIGKNLQEPNQNQNRTKTEPTQNLRFSEPNRRDFGSVLSEIWVGSGSAENQISENRFGSGDFQISEPNRPVLTPILNSLGHFV